MYSFSQHIHMLLDLFWVCLCVCAWTHSNGLQSLFVLVRLFHPATCDTTRWGLKVRDQRLNKYQTSWMNPVTLSRGHYFTYIHLSLSLSKDLRLFWQGSLQNVKIVLCSKEREREPPWPTILLIIPILAKTQLSNTPIKSFVSHPQAS